MKNGWEVITLGEVVKLEYGKPLAKEDRTPDGDYGVYGANGIKNYSNKAYSKGPSIIVGRKGSAGELTFVTGDFWPLDVTYFTQHNSDLIELKFLMLLLEMANLPSMAKGVKPGINRNDVYALQIPLPPLEEQKRIVSILDEAFEGLDRVRENAEANLRSARELYQAIMTKVFSLEDKSSGELNDNIRFKAIGDVCRVVGGGTPSKANNDFWGGDIPWVSPKDMKSDLINDTIDHITTEAIDKSATKLVPMGAILLVVRSGILARKIPIALAGRDLSINQDLKAILPNVDLDSFFMAYFLKANESELLDRVTLGATVHKLDTPKIKDLRVPILSQNEQKDIVKTLDAATIGFKTLVANYKAKIQDISDLRQSLLQKAFAGELT